MAYRERLKAVLTVPERRLLTRLKSPQHIQDYLDSLPINFEISGETYMSVRRTMAAKTAHCFEGALLAAAAQAYHGEKPLLMDLGTADGDIDHVVALYRINGYWGAISKTNHAILRYRDPVYASPRELAMSFFHEYFLKNGRKSLVSYSAPFDLSRYDPKKWITAGEELFWLVEALDKSRHFPTVPKKNRKLLRKASKIERVASDVTEWTKRGKKNHK